MRAITVTTSAVAVNVDDNVGHVGFRGLSLSDSVTTAGAAVVRVREGTASGNIICQVKLASGTCTNFSHNEAVYVNGDLYFQVVSGNVEGVVYVD